MLYNLKHPVLTHKVSLLRKGETSTNQFRQLIREISSLMVYEATRDFKLKLEEIKTPIATSNEPFLDGQKMVLVPILRAGLGMVDGMLDVIPSAKVGHIGLYRDEKTLEAVEYFVKLPSGIEKREVFVLDPMLATGGSANMAISLLKKRGAKKIKLLCILGSKEGIASVQQENPDVDIYITAVDEKLNDKGYITPGLGDAGDRLFGTK